MYSVIVKCTETKMKINPATVTNLYKLNQLRKPKKQVKIHTVTRKLPPVKEEGKGERIDIFA